MKKTFLAVAAIAVLGLFASCGISDLLETKTCKCTVVVTDSEGVEISREIEEEKEVITPKCAGYTAVTSLSNGRSETVTCSEK